MKATVYNQKGTKSGDITISDEIFGLPANDAQVHQVFVSMNSNQRVNIAHTKDRSEVRGGGKKPWKQKGTGRARHGSIRSPIWIGGGITFGPRNEKNFSKKINKKMKTKALFTVLSQKMRDGEIIFVDSLSFDTPKTKDAQNVLDKLAGVKGAEGLANKKNNRAFIALNEGDVNTVKSFANFSNVTVDELRKLNIMDLLKYKYLVITNPEESLKALESRITAEANA